MASVVTLEQEAYEPTEWQLEDLEYLAERTWSANWSEMGCYKTTTGLWLAERKAKLRSEKPNVLVITTRNGKGTYYDAVPKTLKGWKFYDVNVREIEEIVAGMFRFKLEPERVIYDVRLGNNNYPQIFLAHYHCFTNKAAIRGLLKQVDWDFVLIDEAHRIKNRKAQWSRGVKEMRSQERHAMTGTGFINDPSEFWSIWQFLNRKEAGGFWDFRKNFCNIVTVGGFDKVSGINPDKKEEFKTIRKSLGPRRMMADVHKGVSEPIYTPFTVELNPTQRKMYDEIKIYLQTLDKKGEPIYSPNVLSQLNRLRQICVATPDKIRDYYDEKLERRVQEIQLIEPSSKLDAVMEIMEGLEWDEESKQQVVIFSCFKDPLKLLEARLQKADIPYLRMLQSDDDEERYKKWHDTWPSKQHRAFLTTIQLGGESINLSAAQYAIFLDRSWSPKDNSQAVSRIYRPGQTAVPQIININARKTTDQYMKAVNDKKMKWFREIFSDEDE